MVVPAAQVAHAAVPPVSARTTSVVTADGLPTAQINGVVWTQAVAGDRVFAGGEFTRARPPGAAPGTQERTRWNLISYNLQTGALNNFAPQFNGPVKAVAVSPDGRTLYVGGSFTRVGSVVRNRFAAFRISNSDLLPHRPSFNATVEAITSGSQSVFVGGAFTTVNGQSRPRLAAVSASSGVLTGWAPAADSTVRALVLTGNRHKVIAGGRFQQVNGADGRGLVALNATTAARQAWRINTVVRNSGPNAAIISLAADGDTVYGTGYVFGAGGNFEGVFAADDTVGDVRWINDCHGDTYGVAAVGGVIYSVGHPHFCGNIGGFPEMYPLAQRAMAMTKGVLGTVATNTQPGRSGNFGGRPAPSIYNWFPDLTPGTFTGTSQAAWSVAATADYIVAGGEFTAVNGVGQQGLVRFVRPGRAAERQGPVDRSAATAPSVTASSGGTAAVSWRSNWDRDQLTLYYDVLRNGALIRTVTGNSTFWNRPTRRITDSGLQPGTTYRYRIRVRDIRRNTVLSPEVVFTYPGAALEQNARQAEPQATDEARKVEPPAIDKAKQPEPQATDKATQVEPQETDEARQVDR